MDAFFSEQRTNCCVVCGTHDHYLRYRIFPSCYRKHLPVELKSHRSHDVVLLCVACHEIANKSAERVKREIAQEYNVPMHPRVVVDNSGQGSELDVGLCRRSAIVLHKHGKQLPMDRRRYGGFCGVFCETFFFTHILCILNPITQPTRGTGAAISQPALRPGNHTTAPCCCAHCEPEPSFSTTHMCTPWPRVGCTHVFHDHQTSQCRVARQGGG